MPKIKDAQAALLKQLKTEHKKAMDELNKGDKASDATAKTIIKVANSISKTYQSKVERSE